MPLVYLVTGWLIGIGLASLLRPPIEVLLLAAIVPGIGLVLWWKDQRARLIWLSAVCAILGGLRFAISIPHFDQNSLSTYNGIGVVTLEGVVLVRPSRPAEFKYGDRVRVSGELTVPPEFATFSYADFLARQGVYSMIDRPRVSVLGKDQGSPIIAAIYAFRDRADIVIKQILPEPSASLLTGILLGDDSGLPQSVQDEFRRTGTTHIIAISGQI